MHGSKLYLQGGTLAPPARPPLASNFHGGHVKFDKYQPSWQALQALFVSKSQADHCYGLVKDSFGQVTCQSYQPDWIVRKKERSSPVYLV